MICQTSWSVTVSPILRACDRTQTATMHPRCHQRQRLQPSCWCIMPWHSASAKIGCGRMQGLHYINSRPHLTRAATFLCLCVAWRCQPADAQSPTVLPSNLELTPEVPPGSALVPVLPQVQQVVTCTSTWFYTTFPAAMRTASLSTDLGVTVAAMHISSRGFDQGSAHG